MVLGGVQLLHAFHVNYEKFPLLIFQALYTYTIPTYPVGVCGMTPFLILIAQLVFIAIVQTVVEAVLDQEENPRQVKIANLACIIASYGLLIRFAINHLWPELISLANIAF